MFKVSGRRNSQQIREFLKIGDPNIVPQIVGSLLLGPQNKVPLIFGKLPNQGWWGRQSLWVTVVIVVLVLLLLTLHGPAPTHETLIA